MSAMQFLKLGGSLITDKHTPSTARPDMLARIAAEIKAARATDPQLKLVLGHGSGSFGHAAAKQYGTREGVHGPEEWRGFAEVWFQASALNRIVVNALYDAGLPVVSYPPSAGALGEDGAIGHWEISPIRQALERGLLPVIYGDVVFDAARGGTIFSTEDLFMALASELKPARIYLAGLETGVWADFPACTQMVPEITPANLPEILPALGGSTATDVTGGMLSKVNEMLSLVQAHPGLEVLIFSGENEGSIRQALAGEIKGTLIHA